MSKKRCGSIWVRKRLPQVGKRSIQERMQHRNTARATLSLLKRTDGDSRYLPSPRASHVQCSRTCQLVKM